MRKRELISVIIPMYNVSNHIEHIMSDVINQTYDNIEIIVVDDGSTDGTREKLVEYEKRDNRIKVIYADHKGPSGARNVGLSVSTGKYIRFIDADDRVPSYSIEKMAQSYYDYEDIDLVIGNYSCESRYHYYTGKEIPTQIVDAQAFTKAFVDRVKTFYFGVLWNKLYRRDIIENNALSFDENIIWCEDLLFNFSYYEKANKISFLNIEGGIYDYYINDSSITRTLFVKWKDDFHIIEKIRYERGQEFFSRYNLKNDFELEWSNSMIFSKMIDITRGKKGKSIVKKYSEFKELLKDAQIVQYAAYKKQYDNKRFWRKIEKYAQYKWYGPLYMYISMKRYNGAIAKRFPALERVYFDRFWPKEL